MGSAWALAAPKVCQASSTFSPRPAKAHGSPHALEGLIEPPSETPHYRTDPAAEARRIAVQFAHSWIYQDRSVKFAIVTTEVANNWRSTRGKGSCSSARSESLILSIDHGPGMRVQACLEDGFSTDRNSGNRLGAIVRLSERFDAYSSGWHILAAGFGTWPRNAGSARAAMKGETVCGDSWSALERDDTTLDCRCGRSRPWPVRRRGLGSGGRIFESSRFTRSLA